MSKNRLFSVLAVFALVGFAACGGGDDAGNTEVLTDTVTMPGTETVQVPVTDSALVTTEVTADTSVDTTRIGQ